MKKINRKVLIFIAIIFIILVIVFISLNRQKNDGESLKTERINQEVQIPNYFKGQSFEIKNDIKKGEFDFPKTMSYLSLQKKSFLNFEVANKIATNLGINSEPLRVKDVENGEILIWNGEKHSLVATPKTGEINISSPVNVQSRLASVIDKKLDTDEYKGLAEDFLVNVVGVKSEDLSFNGISFFGIETSDEHLQKSDENNAQIFQANFSTSKSPVPIITLNPDQSQIFVQLLKDGSVLFSNIFYGNYFEESLNKYQIKNYEEFSDQINKSVIVSLDDGEINIPDLESTDIKSITVNNVEIAYLIDKPQKEILQPIFLIKGTALIGDINETVSLVMYLPAYK